MRCVARQLIPRPCPVDVPRSSAGGRPELDLSSVFHRRTAKKRATRSLSVSPRTPRRRWHTWDTLIDACPVSAYDARATAYGGRACCTRFHQLAHHLPGRDSRAPRLRSAPAGGQGCGWRRGGVRAGWVRSRSGCEPGPARVTLGVQQDLGGSSRMLQGAELRVFLDHGDVPMHNNLSELMLRHAVVGRRSGGPAVRTAGGRRPRRRHRLHTRR